MDTTTLPEMSAALEAAAVRALLRDWEQINYSHFRDALKPPVLVLSDVAGRLGRWSSVERTIEIARTLVLRQPWGVVVEVLKHEMAHQYAFEVIGAHDETAHGPAFHRACAMLGIDPAASGLPRGANSAPDAESRVLSRVAKLLALAGSPNAHEAQAAMRGAQRLMLKYNLDETKARGREGAANYGFRQLGEPTGRLQAHQRILASILGSHFFVKCIWITVHRPLVGTSATVLEICGTAPNLTTAAYAHDFLLRAAEHLWRDHKRAKAIRGDGPRRSYLVGVMRGFNDKLDGQEKEHRAQGLVWVGDPALARYYTGRNPRVRSVRSKARHSSAAFAEGREAGRTIVLHRGVESGGGGSRGRLLPSGPRN